MKRLLSMALVMVVVSLVASNPWKSRASKFNGLARTKGSGPPPRLPIDKIVEFVFGDSVPADLETDLEDIRTDDTLDPRQKLSAILQVIRTEAGSDVPELITDALKDLDDGEDLKDIVKDILKEIKEELRNAAGSGGRTPPPLPIDKIVEFVFGDSVPADLIESLEDIRTDASLDPRPKLREILELIRTEAGSDVPELITDALEDLDEGEDLKDILKEIRKKLQGRKPPLPARTILQDRAFLRVPPKMGRKIGSGPPPPLPIDKIVEFVFGDSVPADLETDLEDIRTDDSLDPRQKLSAILQVIRTEAGSDVPELITDALKDLDDGEDLKDIVKDILKEIREELRNAAGSGGRTPPPLPIEKIVEFVFGDSVPAGLIESLEDIRTDDTLDPRPKLSAILELIRTEAGSDVPELITDALKDLDDGEDLKDIVKEIRKMLKGRKPPPPVRAILQDRAFLRQLKIRQKNLRSWESWSAWAEDA